MTGETIVIDASKCVLGRVASYAAKQALLGKKIIIVNCEEVILTGRKKSIIEEYNSARRRGGSSLKGPFFPNIPEKLVKRTIRGMLSYTKQRGLGALKRIKCYNKILKEHEADKKIVLTKEKKTKTIKLNELSKRI
jgi:large subunit ribosomal protein L13